MAVAAAEATQSVSAQVVGNAFAQQYYNILHQSPEVVHRFYQDTSKLGRPEDDGSLSITTTMSAINEKILSLNYGKFRAEIKSVDAQESYNGGVHVLVTGYLTGKDSMIRNFTQTFFLAPQDKGYFVLNDIFRYVENNDNNQHHDDDGEDKSLVSGVEVAVDPERSNACSPSVPEAAISEHTSPMPEEPSLEEIKTLPENGEIPILKKENVPVPEVVDEVQDQSQVIAESSSKFEEVPKKSYASIVMDLRESSLPFTSPAPPRKSAPKFQDQQVNLLPFKVAEAPVSSDVTENGNAPETESEGYSIYIRGLPFNAPPSLVEEVFKKFGPIKADGIQVRNNRLQGFCFGFVEYEIASSVQKAMEASPVTIGGRQAVVEEKRSTNSRGNNNRGRFQNGGGSGYRSEGGRGRGNYGGGRGYNRNDNNGRAEFGSRGVNRGFSNRGGDGYQRAGNMGNYGNRNRSGGMGNGTVKNLAPRIPATA